MAKKSVKRLCWAAIGGSFLLANYASEHSWPLWTITLAGAIFVSAALAYVLTMQSS